MKKNFRIGILVGEASGDILGAGLMKAIKERYPEVRFEGIAGPRMLDQGMSSFFPMEKLSVMGLFEVLKHLPELLRIRRYVLNHFLTNPPDVFIGIDAPDFCIPVEKKLRAAGIKTVHYVSPSVWAWRQKRVFKIKQAVDLMLCLLPFEKEFYDQYQVPAKFVGHTLADALPMEPDIVSARQQLGLKTNDLVVCLMPGSRRSEVQRLGQIFFETAARCQEQQPRLQFIVPCVNEYRKQELETFVTAFPSLNVTLLNGQSHEAMAASDAVLLASGTAALEAMLLKKPMVVSYRLSELTWQIAKRAVKTQWVSLPNLLAGRQIVPELLQHDATPEKLAEALLHSLQDDQEQSQLQETYRFLHKQLKRDADYSAAQAVLELLDVKE